MYSKIGVEHFCGRIRLSELGKIGEVGPPASGLSYFTFSLFAPAVLNGNLALRGKTADVLEGVQANAKTNT
jgi:hypothetical protein